MKSSKFISLIVILGTLYSSSTSSLAFTNDSNSPSAYIVKEDLSPLLLPSPPNEGSPEWHKQINQVIAAQKNISAADIAAIKDEQHMRLDLMTSIMGDDFTRERLPKTFVFLDRVFSNAALISEADKNFWHTRRPYLTDKNVKLYIDRIDASPAFPSGHTSDTRVLAEVLGMLKPEKLGDLRAHAEAIAQHRVEAGAHYPNDLEGGRLLAMLIVGALSTNDDFQDDLEVARKEIASH